jgi:ATP-dependent exoDNAse (exonuclease V) beta subunit
MPKIHEPYFEKIGHIYETPDGKRLDSVTQILKSELGLWQFGTCDAAERGTRVHLACQYFDEERLDFSTVSEIDRPYLDSYIKAKKELKIKVLQNEIRRYHPTYMYAGTLDKLAEVGKQGILVDIKTGSKEHSYRWQTAAYLKLIEQESKRKWRRMGLYLSTTGYKVEWHDNPTDWTEFLSLWAAYNVKKNYGYIK